MRHLHQSEYDTLQQVFVRRLIEQRATLHAIMDTNQGREEYHHAIRLNSWMLADLNIPADVANIAADGLLADGPCECGCGRPEPCYESGLDGEVEEWA